nr:hypothetical protein BJQ95_01830 [Cryobacterium sp. SO1]
MSARAATTTALAAPIRRSAAGIRADVGATSSRPRRRSRFSHSSQITSRVNSARPSRVGVLAWLGPSAMPATKSSTGPSRAASAARQRRATESPMTVLSSTRISAGTNRAW